MQRRKSKSMMRKRRGREGGRKREEKGIETKKSQEESSNKRWRGREREVQKTIREISGENVEEYICREREGESHNVKERFIA